MTYLVQVKVLFGRLNILCQDSSLYPNKVLSFNSVCYSYFLTLKQHYLLTNKFKDLLHREPNLIVNKFDCDE